MRFTGTQVKVKDDNPAELVLKLLGKDEFYNFVLPEVTVGNLGLPNLYMEPQGSINVVNESSKILV